jgi:EAL and modified HD-GYP domain-containing signal transduction protein
MEQYIGRQPIVTVDDGIFAYDLFYRDTETISTSQNARQATATVIMNVLNKFGTTELLGGYKAFIKVDRTFFMHDLIWSVPKEFFNICLLESVPMDERVIERIQQMHAKGFTVCLNDLTIKDIESFKRYSPVLPYLGYIKVNGSTTPLRTVAQIYNTVAPYELSLIATKIEERDIFETCKNIGIQYFQGFYFAKPNLLESKSFDPNHMSVMRLCNMLMSDVDIDEIAQAFEQNHALTLQLLRFINSAAFHFNKRISSIRQILTLLGRTPLTQWLLMMVYSKSVSKDNNQVSPIVLMVKNRTELMTGLLKLIPDPPDSIDAGEAYLVGVLSLIETVFNVKLSKVLEALSMSEHVETALLHNEGFLSEMLELVKSIEHFDISQVDEFVSRHHINEEAVEKLLIATIENVNSFDQSLKSMQEEGA